MIIGQPTHYACSVCRQSCKTDSMSNVINAVSRRTVYAELLARLPRQSSCDMCPTCATSADGTFDCKRAVSLKHDGPTGRATGQTDGPSSRPSALSRRRVLPPALPFTTGHLIVGRYYVLRSEDDGPGDGQETGPS